MNQCIWCWGEQLPDALTRSIARMTLDLMGNSGLAASVVAFAKSVRRQAVLTVRLCQLAQAAIASTAPGWLKAQAIG